AGCGILVAGLTAITIMAERHMQQQAANVPDSRIITAIQSSDDYHTYPGKFLDGTRKALREGYVTIDNLEEMGGWLRSVAHKPRPVYFTYGGDMDTLDDRVYLDLESGRLSRRDL
ncbi:MAG TPA: hypothetical protein VK973_13240, partial [Arenicellales bacterium]|nr:hypothetical protein [Arenicellales bacterium]